MSGKHGMRRAALAALITVAAFAAVPAGTAMAGADTVYVSSPITIPVAGAGTPYPSDGYYYPGGANVITSVSFAAVTLTHAYPDDMDIVLVSPAGQKILLMSDSCGTHDLDGAPMLFIDGATPLPDELACTPGFPYAPTDNAPGENLPAPAPAGPYSTTLGSLVGTDPTGHWQLYAADDFAGDAGIINSWYVTFATPDGTMVVGEDAGRPYPRSISGATPTGPISDVNVDLGNIDHTNPDDLDVLLVSPSGKAVLLASDACGPANLVGTDITFDDEASPALPDSGPCPSGAYKPSQYDAASDTFPAGAPAPPYATTLSVFDGELSASGWRVYVRDDNSGADGGLIGTMTLNLTFATPPVGFPPNAPASSYPLTKTVSTGRPVTSVSVQLDGLTHTNPDSLEALLVGPTGTSTLLLSDACGSTDMVDQKIRFSDDALGPVFDSGPCPPGIFKPADYPTLGEAQPAPAPAPPYGADFSGFTGTNPDGDWKLYLSTDSTSGRGFLTGDWTLDVKTRDGAPVSFAAASTTAAEGASATLTLNRSAASGLLPGSVRVDTAAGSASAGEDFTALGQVVEFAAGETSKTVQVPIVAGKAGEPAETFEVRLSAPTRDAALGTVATAAVTIPADGPAPPAAFTAASAVTLPSNKTCLKRPARLRITPRKPAGQTIDRITASIGKKTLTTRKGASARKAFTLSKLPSGTFKLTIKVQTTSGKSAATTRTYKVCT